MVQKIVKTDQWIEPVANFDYLNLKNNFYINFKKAIFDREYISDSKCDKKVTS